ncbi:hypothetical protein RI129_008716 [Pyrocoelia pectoralis]|uniref:DUF4780 domain-containing protein n=1 Tax=Pyrocoelia pectoralis TaxID=417401 RepID=A0AAN7VAD0_9COLE
MVQDHLAKILDQYLFSSTGEFQVPTFKGWRYSDDILRISCENIHSLEWLKKVVGNLPPLWEGAHLKVVQEDQISKIHRVALWISGEPEEFAIVKERLEVQNSWTDIDNWRVFHTSLKENPTGRLIIFGVGEETHAKLIAKGGKLNYKFSSLKLKLTNPGEVHAPGPSRK